MEIIRIRQFIGAVLIGCLMWIPIAQAQVSDFPDLTLTTTTGTPYTISGAGVKIIFFFDAASQTDSNFFQLLNKIAYSFRGNDLQIIGVYSDLEPLPIGRLDEIKQKNSLSFPLYLDPERLALKKFAIAKAPAIFIADNQGKISYHTMDIKVEYYPLTRHIKYALGFIDGNALRSSLTAQAYLPPMATPLAAATRNYKQLIVAQPSDKQPVIAQPGDKQPVIAQPGDKQPVIAQPGDKQPVVAQPGDKQPIVGQPGDKQPVVTQPGDKQPIVGQPGDKQPIVDQPGDKQPVVAQPGDKQPQLSPVTQLEKPVLKPLAATLLPETLGYKPYKWGLNKDMRSMVLALGGDLLVKVLPIFIWGWAILYILAKLTKYNGMLCGLLVAFGMLCFSLIHLSMDIPFQLCILSSHLWQLKTLVLHYYQMLTPYPVEKALYLILQLALLRALAGRFKKEQEVIA